MFATRCAATSQFSTPPRKISFSDAENMLDTQLPIIDGDSVATSCASLVQRLFPDESPCQNVLAASSSSGPAEQQMHKSCGRVMTPKDAKMLWTNVEPQGGNQDKVPHRENRFPKDAIFAMYGLDAPASAIPHEVSDLVAALLKAKPAPKNTKPNQKVAELLNAKPEESSASGKPAEKVAELLKAKPGEPLQLQAEPVSKFSVVIAADQTYVCGYNDKKTLS